MRDAIEIFEYADHQQAWGRTLLAALRQAGRTIRWAGEAFRAFDAKKISRA